MTDSTVLKGRLLRAPPLVDERTLSQALQDLFASWRHSLKDEFKGLTATGEIAPDLFPLRSTGAAVQPMIAAVEGFFGARCRSARGGELSRAQRGMAPLEQYPS